MLLRVVSVYPGISRNMGNPRDPGLVIALANLQEKLASMVNGNCGWVVNGVCCHLLL